MGVYPMAWTCSRCSQRLLNVGVPEPLDIATNDAALVIPSIDAAILSAQDELVNASSAQYKDRAEQAIAALRRLKEQYSSNQPSPDMANLEDFDAALEDAFSEVENEQDFDTEQDKALAEVVPPLPFWRNSKPVSGDCCN